MSQDGNIAGESPAKSNETKSTKLNDIELALNDLFAAIKEFEHEFKCAIESRVHFGLRLEIRGDGGKITDIDTNRFIKRQPRKRNYK